MYIIIVNSYSGQHRYKKIMKHLNELLHTPFVTYYTDQYQGNNMWHDINGKINEIKTDALGIIIVGGDGTLHQAVQHLHHHTLPFGLIPTGSGNDFGRALNIPRNIKKAIERINNREIKTYDLLDVNERKVLSIVGIGVDAETAIKCQHSFLKKLLNRAFLGRLTYLMVFLQTVIHYKPLNVTIYDSHGEKNSFEKVWLIAGGNTSYYGGGIPICPLANPQDGEIDLVIVHSLSLIRLMLALPSVFIKKHLNLPYVTMIRGKDFSIISNELQGVQGDGEEIGSTPAKIKLLEKAIRFF
ncbi:YegS/Rv2252/BmrU family lipid kinase [Evansella sp. AB-P1]|uniref:diacylglycerol/lipid kinase family protein n=1 Tax=Evansella sp. AB-P1 TaxID=3037653 RepID=UPI00241CAE3D|nr:YegS/Rv2252/BmrU family lipid kinase [Evansella sp. AB-P1]MDG5787534.1 YegS/Rv2252/BmrU family lipid kinase [Evansella sp. AB-P1]